MPPELGTTSFDDALFSVKAAVDRFVERYMKTYHLTAAGRRTTIIMMIAALLLWVFALWMLSTTLGVRLGDFRSSLNAVVDAGLSVSQLVQVAILVVMIVAAPLLWWSLWEEWNTTYTVGDDGLTYRTTNGISIHYPWSQIREIRADGSDKAEVVVAHDGATQIRQPVLRWLHRQGFDGGRIPIYAGVEARDALLDDIAVRSGIRRSEATRS